MNTRVALVLGHPMRDSFCAALAAAYAQGVRDAGAEVRELFVGDMKFDPVLWKGYREIQALEPDLLKAQGDLVWANHLVFAYPIWWGVPPAVFKGFIDRTFHPGFAFKFAPGKVMPTRLLKGRSARLIVTMDSPPWYFRLLMGGPGHKMMARSVLGFCGVRPVRISSIGSVKTSTPDKRARWLADMQELGRRLR